MKKGIIIIIILAVVVGLGVIFLKKSPSAGNTNQADSSQSLVSKSSRELALMCDPTEHVAMHIHPVLQISINGQDQVIPEDIGIKTSFPTCLHFIHTHDTTGVIHVESPVMKDYTLGDFFAVWGKTFSKDQILDSKVDETHKIRVTVDGQDNTDFENIILKDKEQIVISYENK